MSVKGVEWVKLAVDTFDDEKVKLIRSLPDGDTIALVWVQLICHAGKVNADGVVRVADGLPYSDEMLATVLGHPISTVRLAINTFTKFGMVSLDDNGIWLTNWDKYQNIDGMQRIREQTRLRVARHRENKRLLLPPVTLPVTLRNALEEEEDTDKDKDITTSSTHDQLSDETLHGVTPLLTELSRLPGWAQSKDNHDAEWLSEFMCEFPRLTVTTLRACRDYHFDKKKHSKGSWKLRIRHWMENEGNGQHQNRRRHTGEVSAYDPTPAYDRPLTTA